MSRGVLPPLVEPWIEEVLGGPVPVETRATCARCVMLARGGEDDPVVPFDAGTKCCTYTPYLSNFLCGGILGDDSPEVAAGRRELEARIAAGVGVTPLGIWPSAERHARYAVAVGAEPAGFGRTPQLRCPYYQVESGQCGIWRHREATCATWYCRHERGMRSRRFWSVLRGLLATIERSLSLYCLDEIGLDAAACEALYFEEPGAAVAPEVWGTFRGAERDLFLACAGVVGPLAWRDVFERAGAPVQHLVRVLRYAHAELHDESLPPELDLEPMVLHQIGGGRIRVWPTRWAHDFLELPPEVVEALPRLCRRPLAEALTELQNIGIDESLVMRLVDFEILGPART